MKRTGFVETSICIAFDFQCADPDVGGAGDLVALVQTVRRRSFGCGLISRRLGLIRGVRCGLRCGLRLGGFASGGTGHRRQTHI